jgi:hypothetical protein
MVHRDGSATLLTHAPAIYIQGSVRLIGPRGAQV